MSEIFAKCPSPSDDGSPYFCSSERSAMESFSISMCSSRRNCFAVRASIHQHANATTHATVMGISMARLWGLQRNQAMFFGRAELALRMQAIESLREIAPGLRRFDNVIHKLPAGSYVGIGERTPIVFDQLRALRCFVFSSVDFVAGDNLNRAFRAHHGNFGGWPRDYAVCPKVFAAHCNISASVGFAQHHRDLRNCSGGIGKQNLGAVANDSAEFLIDSRQEAGRIDERKQRNVECVAEAHEPCHLVGGINIEHSREDGGLASDDAQGAALNSTESDNDIGRIAGLNFKKVAVIHQMLDHLPNVVGNFGVGGN